MCDAESEAATRAFLEVLFPNLRHEDWAITSSHDPGNNCVALACHDSEERWEPGFFWPADIRRNMAPATVVSLFELQGYQWCDSRDLEPGLEKVAIYIEDNRLLGFAHVARQLPSGKWVSKLGDRQDIEHTSPAGLEGEAYGTVRIVMSRSR